MARKGGTFFFSLAGPGEKTWTFFFSLARWAWIEVDGCMPRTARASAGDICYHVFNRGNAQIEVFHKDGDYRGVVELIGCLVSGLRGQSWRIASCQIISTSFRGLVRIGTLAVLTAHVRRYHQHVQAGHVWQVDSKHCPSRRIIICSRCCATLSETR